MKRLLVLFLLLPLLSCDLDQEPAPTQYLLPTLEVDGPETLIVGQVAEFNITYKRPTECFIFNGFMYQMSGFNRYISIRAVDLNQADCSEVPTDTFEVPLRFEPQQAGTYELNFWAGNTGENNEAAYITREITVTNQ